MENVDARTHPVTDGQVVYPPELTRLISVTLPPALESAAGYIGHRRFAGLWLDTGRLTVADGMVVHVGNRAAFEIFVTSPLVHNNTRPFRIGLGGEASTHALMVDRRERRLWIGPRRTVLSFLAANVALSTDTRRSCARNNGPALMEELQQWLEMVADVDRYRRARVRLPPVEWTGVVVPITRKLKQS